MTSHLSPLNSKAPLQLFTYAVLQGKITEEKVSTTLYLSVDSGAPAAGNLRPRGTMAHPMSFWA